MRDKMKVIGFTWHTVYVRQLCHQTAGILHISVGPEVLQDEPILLLTPKIFLQPNHVITYVHTQRHPYL
jgi:hypothetical protein